MSGSRRNLPANNLCSFLLQTPVFATIKPSLFSMPETAKQRVHVHSALASKKEVLADELHLPPVYLKPSVLAAPSTIHTLFTISASITFSFSHLAVFSSYPYSTLSSAFALGGHHSSPTPNSTLATSSCFPLSRSTSVPSSMGQTQSLIPSSLRTPRPSPSARRHTFSSLVRPLPLPTAKVIPSDNIFVPIQPDDIPGQIPIHIKHPLPRTGIEDSDRPVQTNKFYANAFLGKQDQPVWTQPYFLWWGRGGSDPKQFPTWGMNVGHVQSEDLEVGPGDPPKVRKLWRSFDANWILNYVCKLTLCSIISRLGNNWLCLGRVSFLMEQS